MNRPSRSNSDSSSNRRNGDGRNAPRGRRSRSRRRERPVPEDVALADSLEDGHDRVIDCREYGASIYADHGLDHADLDADAVKVLRRLHRYGFQAYLVGGCVRDILLGREPKDYDIATSATPKQIRELFRNSRVIGRRFRLVHIHFGRHILEVSTFRSPSPVTVEEEDPLIRRDNVFGTADQDAFRRDFTINALFFDIENNEVIDFVGGMEDLRRRRLVIIGDPETRLREDPVRMMRAAKFAGRLRFEVAEDLLDAMCDCGLDLKKCPAPRVFEEIQRMLDQGGAHGSLDVLWETRILEVLLPEVDVWLEVNEEKVDDTGLTGSQRFWNSLRTLDRYVIDGYDVSSVTKMGTILCHLFSQVLNQEGPQASSPAAHRFDMGALTDEVLRPAALRLQIPRREYYRLRQVLSALRRLMVWDPAKKNAGANQLVKRDYFPETLRLFQIYAHACGRWQHGVSAWTKRYESVTGRAFH